MWEKRIKCRTLSVVNRNWGTDVATAPPAPGLCSEAPGRWAPLPASTGKKQRELWAHKASATAVPRELETLERGCKNQDFINRGRRRENGQLPELSTVIRGISLKSTPGKEQKI